MQKKIIVISLIIIIISTSIIPTNAESYDNLLIGVRFDEMTNDDGTFAKVYGDNTGTITMEKKWAKTLAQMDLTGSGLSSEDINFPVLYFYTNDVPATPIYNKVNLQYEFKPFEEVTGLTFPETQKYEITFEFDVYGYKNGQGYDWNTGKLQGAYIKTKDGTKLDLNMTYEKTEYTLRIKFQGIILGKELKNIYQLFLTINKDTMQLQGKFRFGISSDKGFEIREYTEADEIIDKEKEESLESGNESIDSVTNAMPDHSSGLLSAIGNLVSAFTYSGTDSKIVFTGIKTPAFEDLGIEEQTLLTEQEINLTEPLELIPDTILTLVQSVVTVMLILFMVKQLWAEIDYALMGRSDNYNE